MKSNQINRPFTIIFDFHDTFFSVINTVVKTQDSKERGWPQLLFPISDGAELFFSHLSVGERWVKESNRQGICSTFGKHAMKYLLFFQGLKEKIGNSSFYCFCYSMLKTSSWRIWQPTFGNDWIHSASSHWYKTNIDVYVLVQLRRKTAEMCCHCVCGATIVIGQ